MENKIKKQMEENLRSMNNGLIFNPNKITQKIKEKEKIMTPVIMPILKIKEVLEEIVKEVDGVRFKPSPKSLLIQDCPNCGQEVNREYIDQLTVQIKREAKAKIRQAIISKFRE